MCAGAGASYANCFLCPILIEKLEIVRLHDCEGVLFDYVADNNA